MKLFRLQSATNLKLRQLIWLSYSKEEYLTFINSLAHTLGTQQLIENAHTNSVDNLNIILIDNIMEYVKAKDIYGFTHLLTNNTFAHNINVGQHHYLNFIGLDESPEDTFEIECAVKKKIKLYLVQEYLTNPDLFNEALFQIFQELYYQFSGMRILMSKTSIVENHTPILLITEREYGETCSC